MALTLDELEKTLARLVGTVKAAYSDGKVSLRDAYEVVRELVQSGVSLAQEAANLTGEQKRQLVTEAAIAAAEFLLARVTLPPVLSLAIRPALKALLPILVDLLLEQWVTRAKAKAAG